MPTSRPLRDRAGWEAFWSSETRPRWQADPNETSGLLRDSAGLDVGSAEGGAALDVGCGDGRISLRLADRGGLVVGIDHALCALGRVPTSTAGTLVFGAADARSLPFAQASFTLVFDRGLFTNLPTTDRHRYVVEAARVLVPGGRFVLIQPTMRPGIWTTRFGGLLGRLAHGWPAGLECSQEGFGLRLVAARRVARSGGRRPPMMAVVLQKEGSARSGSAH